MVSERAQVAIGIHREERGGGIHSPRVAQEMDMGCTDHALKIL